MDNLIEKINQILEDNKALDIKTLDLRKKSNYIHYLVIATATSTTHNRTLATKLVKELKSDFKAKNIIVDGLDSGNWIAIDLNSTIVHLFLQEVREYYNIESLWA